MPQAYQWLKDQDVYTQIADQHFFTELEIDSALTQLPDSRQLNVRYEEICSDPALFLTQISERLKERGFPANEMKSEIELRPGNTLWISQAEISKLRSAYERFQQKTASGR